MTSNFQLLEFAKKKHLDKVSILCKDELTKVKLRPNLNFIINMSDADDSNGTHWTALYVSHNMQPFYMDSFGAPPAKEVIKYLKPLKRKIAYSQFAIQDIKSDQCGIFSLAFLLYMTKKHTAQESYTDTFERFLKQFDLLTQENNDAKLKTLYRSL
jgi:hypothetical protein